MAASTVRRRRAPPRSGVINIRVKPAERALIDGAAAAAGKSRSDFMLEASRRAAQELLLDQVLLRVDRATFARFEALLDAPARPNERLQKLLQLKPPWE